MYIKFLEKISIIPNSGHFGFFLKLQRKFETNQKSLIITEIVQSCMPNQQCTRHVIDRIIDWLKAIKSYLKLFEPKGTRVKS